MSWLEEVRKNQVQKDIIVNGIIDRKRCTISDIASLSYKETVYVINELMSKLKKK